MRDYDWGPQGDPADPDSHAWAVDQTRLERQLAAIDREEADRAWDRQDREANNPGCDGPIALVLGGGALVGLASVYLTHSAEINQAIENFATQLSR